MAASRVGVRLDSNRLDTLLRTLAGILLKPRSTAFQIVFSVAALTLATVSRGLIHDSLPSGYPFLTYFPAILLTLIFAGLRAGIGVAGIGGLLAWYLFIPPAFSFAFEANMTIPIGFYFGFAGLEILFVAVVNTAVQALSDAQQRAAQLARSRELMFAEVQHRVSNNLATVAALLRMQAARTTDAQVRQALTEAQLRINTVARLQRRLHAPELQQVDVPDFLKALVADTVDAANTGRKVSVRLSAEPLMLPQERAIPLGLIASELLMNAIEHGKHVPAAPEVQIHLTSVPQPDGGSTAVTLDLVDNGPGLPEGFSLAGSKSLGLSIAREFARQLGGKLVLSSQPGGGTLARLSFAI